MRYKQKENQSKAEFIMIQGILKTGLGFASTVLVGFYLIDYGFSLDNFKEYIFSTKTIFMYFCNALFFGLFAGFSSWKNHQKQLTQEAEINQ